MEQLKDQEQRKSKMEEEKVKQEEKKEIKNEQVSESSEKSQKLEGKVVQKDKAEEQTDKKQENKEVKEEKPKAKTEKKETIPKIKKEKAVAYGKNLHMSKKQGVYICSFIKNRKIDEAISDLEQVIVFKKAVPFKGEIPHRKGKGMMSGRYPVKGAGFFINILKSLKGNVIVNGLDLDKTKIVVASANWGSRPMRSNRRQGKRTNVIIEAREVKA